MATQNFVNPISSLNENYNQNYVTAKGLINFIPDEGNPKYTTFLYFC